MTKPLRLIYLILFLLLVLVVHSAHTARGQVAVPDFSPAGTRVLVPGTVVPDANFATDNPGAQQWGAPSRFGLGQIRGQVEDDTGGTKDTTNYDGYYAGLRWVTEVFTLAGEVLNLQDNHDGYDTSVTNGALAFPVGKLLAFGIGLDTSSTESGGDTDKRRTPSLGLSVNLDDRFFIGLAMGREYLEHDSGAGNNFDSDRAVQHYGLGFRSGGTAANWHLEYFVTARDAHEDKSVGKFDEQDQSHIVVELNWSNLLLSAHWVDYSIDSVDGTSQIYAVGWAPKKGLALLGQLETASTEANAGNKTDATTTTISLAYQF